MFLKMRRFKQQITEEECIQILKEQPRGVLSLIGEDGYPYGIPMDQYYDEKNGKLYFHCAKEGHKIDAIKANPKACFTIYDQGFRKDGEWALNIKSVVAFGTVEIMQDHEKILEAARRIGLKFYPDAEDVEEEIRKTETRVQCLEMTIDHMTGKLVNES